MGIHLSNTAAMIADIPLVIDSNGNKGDNYLKI